MRVLTPWEPHSIFEKKNPLCREGVLFALLIRTQLSTPILRSPIAGVAVLQAGCPGGHRLLHRTAAQCPAAAAAALSAPLCAVRSVMESPAPVPLLHASAEPTTRNGHSSEASLEPASRWKQCVLAQVNPRSTDSPVLRRKPPGIQSETLSAGRRLNSLNK